MSDRCVSHSHPPTEPMFTVGKGTVHSLTSLSICFLYLQNVNEENHDSVFSLYFLCPSHTMQLLLFSLIWGESTQRIKM